MKTIFETWNTQPHLEAVIYIASTETPLGTMWMGAINEGICFVEFFDRIQFEKELQTLGKVFIAKYILDENHLYLKQLKKELELYFNQKLTAFTVPIVLTGTDFQQKVFRTLQEIPYGKTTTYKPEFDYSNFVKTLLNCEM